MSFATTPSLNSPVALPNCRLREAARSAKNGLQCETFRCRFPRPAQGGLIALPVYVSGKKPHLKSVLANAFDLTFDLWLLTHRDLKSKPQIRNVLDFVAKEAPREQLRQKDYPELQIGAA